MVLRTVGACCVVYIASWLIQPGKLRQPFALLLMQIQSHFFPSPRLNPQQPLLLTISQKGHRAHHFLNESQSISTFLQCSWTGPSWRDKLQLLCWFPIQPIACRLCAGYLWNSSKLGNAASDINGGGAGGRGNDECNFSAMVFGGGGRPGGTLLKHKHIVLLVWKPDDL